MTQKIHSEGFWKVADVEQSLRMCRLGLDINATSRAKQEIAFCKRAIPRLVAPQEKISALQATLAKMESDLSLSSRTIQPVTPAEIDKKIRELQEKLNQCREFLNDFDLEDPITKLHGSEKSMIFDHDERSGEASPIRNDGGLPERAGEELRTRHDQKGRFCAPKSFAIGSERGAGPKRFHKDLEICQKALEFLHAICVNQKEKYGSQLAEIETLIPECASLRDRICELTMFPPDSDEVLVAFTKAQEHLERFREELENHGSDFGTLKSAKKVKKDLSELDDIVEACPKPVYKKEYKRISKEFDKAYDGFHYLLRDPLSTSQKRNIRGFLFTRLPSALLEDDNVLRALSKTYPCNSAALQKAQNVMDAYRNHSFLAVRCALSNPAVADKDFGIDPTDSAEVFAARQYMKAVLKSKLSAKRAEIDALYVEKMSGKTSPGRHHISAKNRLLMRNDPLQPLDPTKAPTPLDIVLANTHFATPVGEDNEKMDREEARKMLAAELHRLSEDPVTRHVIEGLAAVIQNEKGNIIISPDTNSLEPFDEDNHVHGFYNDHHTIVVRSLISPGLPANRWGRGLPPEIDIDNVSTFVHEALHFILNRVVQNDSSPVAPGSPEEAELDKALMQDMTVRKNNFVRTNDRREPEFQNVDEDISDELVVNLEENRSYFNRKKFDHRNPKHMHTLRLEAIVRPLQLQTTGIDHQEIQAFAPHLLKFYESHTKPLIENYAKQSLNLS